ncbi:DUF1289 domain-containing protein [Rhizobium sp. BK196]|jgi:uncharacterized protein|uniref:DUF1289 domain-containing protein n=1 Tax=Rhizobium sp. BK196 TaxID=2587073 RepID=UPI001613AD1A|nr:DUF1289 domain-containing protein [Rhizobium sp. BK196]
MRTPCIRVCSLDPLTGLCAGCGRTTDEIAGWMRFSDKERETIMENLPTRLAALAAESTKTLEAIG